MPEVEDLEEELAAASEDSTEATIGEFGTSTAARNVAEEDTAPYGGLEDKYASEFESVAVENPPHDIDALEHSEEDNDEELYDEEEKSYGKEKFIDDGYTHEDAAATEPDNIAPDASADWQPRDERSLGSNEREQHRQERKEKKRSFKSRKKDRRDRHRRSRSPPSDRHRRARSPPSSRPTSRSRSRSRPRRNDADRVNEYLKSRDASYDEPDSPKNRFKQKVDEGVEEVHGTTQDILLSVFQVCCAFALRGKEINGFVREIDNARNELR